MLIGVSVPTSRVRKLKFEERLPNLLTYHVVDVLKVELTQRESSAWPGWTIGWSLWIVPITGRPVKSRHMCAGWS